MLGFGVRAKALSKLDPMALFYSGTLAPIYTGIDIAAVRDFFFSVLQDKILALVGANGAGKTSTLFSLVDLVERKA